jgi:2-dehydropantoate 2-reductase
VKGTKVRFVVYGVGAVGGTIAARLALSSHEVVGIARGAMLEAIRSDGLRFITVGGTETVRFPCFADPAEFELRDDDVILLTMKSQDTEGALEQLRASGAYAQAVVCAQNGVANERMALRHFPNTYGMTVMLPAQYATPGVVEAFGAPKYGLFNLGRFPSGSGAVAERISAALNEAGFDCVADADVMQSKYGKLLLNVGNIVGAALGTAARFGPWYDAARKEAEAVYRAAGIAFRDVDFDSPRRELMKVAEIPGIERSGSSSLQSLLRGTGSIETDYLNGEIVLLGRLHGEATPVNAAFCRIASRMIAKKIPPGEFPEADVAALVAAS